MNSENSKTSKHVSLTLRLSSKLDLRIGEKVIALSNLSIYYTWRNIKTSYNNNKLKISAYTCNDEFELPDVWYSVSDIQDYFKYIKKKKKKHGQNTNKSAVQTYVNEIENMITFKIKDGYSLELLRNTKNEITGDKNGENIPH